MYRPIAVASDLPEPGRANETRTLDFKAQPTDDSFEIAKDVAAFANAEGGTLLIGARGSGEYLARYEAMTTGEASQVQRTYDNAVKSRCRPSPVFNIVGVPRDNGVVVAVNVAPFPGQLVGVEVKQGEARCGKAGTEPAGLFYFPMRVGAQTTSILPEQMPMFIDSKVRRIAICLNDGIEKTVVIHRARARPGDNSVHVSPMILEKVDVLANAVTVRFSPPKGDVRVAIPFDLIEAAWRSEAGWHLSVLGLIREINWLPNLGTEFEKLKWILDPEG